MTNKEVEEIKKRIDKSLKETRNSIKEIFLDYKKRQKNRNRANKFYGRK